MMMWKHKQKHMCNLEIASHILPIWNSIRLGISFGYWKVLINVISIWNIEELRITTTHSFKKEFIIFKWKRFVQNIIEN